MISLYLLCFILLVAGTFLILELTPETVTDDIMHMVVPEQTLRDKVLIAQKKKKSRKITPRREGPEQEDQRKQNSSPKQTIDALFHSAPFLYRMQRCAIPNNAPANAVSR